MSQHVTRRQFLTASAAAGSVAAFSTESAANGQALAADPGGKPPLRVGLMTYRLGQDWDIDTIIASVKKTGRVVIVHEAPKTCGFGAELISQISERAFLHLEAPRRG